MSSVQTTYTTDQVYTADRAYALEGTVKRVVSFFIVAAIGLIILSEFWSVVDTGSGPFSGVYTQMENMISSVFGLIVLLPLILVAVVAYRMISTKL